MRTAVFACAILATSCAAVLGLRDIEQGDEPVLADPGADDADADAGAIEAAALDPFDAGVIPCFGTQRRAYFCEDFEGPDPLARWAQTISADATWGLSTNNPLSPLHSLGAHSELNGPFQAIGRWTRTDPGTKLAFQLHVYLPNDAWDAGQTQEFAAIEGDGQRGELLFTSSGGANGALSFKIGGASIDLGPVVENTWTCIQLVADGTGVHTSRDGNDKGALVDMKTASTVELGMAMTGLATKTFYYDDVIVAPEPVGCL